MFYESEEMHHFVDMEWQRMGVWRPVQLMKQKRRHHQPSFILETQVSIQRGVTNEIMRAI